MISLCEKGDLNISIRCNAEIFKEEMVSNPAMCIVKAKIVDIKDDSTHSETIRGIRYRCKTERGRTSPRMFLTSLTLIRAKKFVLLKL